MSIAIPITEPIIPDTSEFEPPLIVLTLDKLDTAPVIIDTMLIAIPIILNIIVIVHAHPLPFNNP